MKSNAIVRIIIWSTVILLLSGILIWMLGVRFDIFPDILYHSSSGERWSEAVPVATEFVVTPVQPLPNEEKLAFPSEINEVDIDWAAGDIVIMGKDVDKITVSESDVSDERYSLQYQVRGNKLEIIFCEERLMAGFGISFGADLRKDLYIEVPKNWVGRSIEIDAASANVEMYDITLQKMDFDGASGTCDFQNCQISDLDIDTASGDVYFSGTLDSLDFDAASASFTGDLQNTPSRIDMDSMSGKLDIALPEDCGYSLTMDDLSSSFRSDFQDTEMKHKSHVYGDGRCRINVDGMRCDVTIRKLDTIYVPAATAETDPTVDPTVESVPPCTGPNCGDPTCPEHHGSADCTDPACPRHHAVSALHHEEPHSGNH